MKTAQTTITSEPVVNRVRFLLVWFTFLFAGLLWLAFAAILLRHGHFRLMPFPAPALFLLVALTGAASCALHFFHSAVAEWNAYPYWLEESWLQKMPLLVSIPNLLTALLLLGWHLSWLTFFPVLTLVLFELAVCRFVPCLGESFARRLRSLITDTDADPLGGESSYAPFERSASLSPLPLFSPETDTIRLHPEESLSRAGELSDEDEDECEPPPPADLLASQNRCLNSDGTEREEGWFRVPFHPGETVAVCHLSFCPPFRSRPKLQLFQLEGDEVQITPTVIEPHGVRIEIKRASSSNVPGGAPTADRSVRICFFADESKSPDK